MAKNLVLASCTFSILPQVAGGTNEDGNNSTLRRKLFAGLDDDDDGSDVEKDQRDSSGWALLPFLGLSLAFTLSF